MDKLKMMKEQLTAQVECQLADIHNADAKELGEAVDMIKDLAEAIYYCTVTEAMDDKEKKEKEHHYYYTEKMYPYYPKEEYYGYEGWPPRMYYDGNGSGGRGSSGSNGSSMGSSTTSGNGRYYTDQPRNSDGEFTSRNGGGRYYTEREMRDMREGRSPEQRRRYMEAKEMHQDEPTKIKELEAYMQELTRDIAEMIQDASPSEKQLLQKKVSSLATKIEQLNA